MSSSGLISAPFCAPITTAHRHFGQQRAGGGGYHGRGGGGGTGSLSPGAQHQRIREENRQNRHLSSGGNFSSSPGPSSSSSVVNEGSSSSQGGLSSSVLPPQPGPVGSLEDVAPLTTHAPKRGLCPFSKQRTIKSNTKAIRQVLQQGPPEGMPLPAVARELPDEVLETMEEGLRSFVQTTDPKKETFEIVPPPGGAGGPPWIRLASQVENFVPAAPPQPNFNPRRPTSPIAPPPAPPQANHVPKNASKPPAGAGSVSGDEDDESAQHTRTPATPAEKPPLKTQAAVMLRAKRAQVTVNSREVPEPLDLLELVGAHEELPGCLIFNAVPNTWEQEIIGYNRPTRILRADKVCALVKELGADAVLRGHKVFASIHPAYAPYLVHRDERGLPYADDSQLPRVEEYDVMRAARFVTVDSFTPLHHLARVVKDVSSQDLMHILLCAPDLFQFDSDTETTAVKFILEDRHIPVEFMLKSEEELYKIINDNTTIINNHNCKNFEKMRARRFRKLAHVALYFKANPKLSCSHPAVLAYLLFDCMGNREIPSAKLVECLPPGPKNVAAPMIPFLKCYPHLFKVYEHAAKRFTVLRADVDGPPLPDDLIHGDSDAVIVDMIKQILLEKDSNMLPIHTLQQKIPFFVIQKINERSLKKKKKSELRSFLEDHPDDFFCGIVPEVNPTDPQVRAKISGVVVGEVGGELAGSAGRSAGVASRPTLGDRQHLFASGRTTTPPIRT